MVKVEIIRLDFYCKISRWDPRLTHLEGSLRKVRRILSSFLRKRAYLFIHRLDFAQHLIKYNRILKRPESHVGSLVGEVVGAQNMDAFFRYRLTSICKTCSPRILVTSILQIVRPFTSWAAESMFMNKEPKYIYYI